LAPFVHNELMENNCKVIELSDVETLLSYEDRRLSELFPNPEERMFHQWESRGRKEFLEHYASLGWSFKVEIEPDIILGYLLAQPILFFAGQPQTLWVESLQASSLEARDLLTDLAYRMAKEKHFQGVYYPSQQKIFNSISVFKPEIWSEQPYFVKTTRR